MSHRLLSTSLLGLLVGAACLLVLFPKNQQRSVPATASVASPGMSIDKKDAARTYGGLIRGTVVDEGGPVADARISVPGHTASTWSNMHGAFAIPDPGLRPL